MGVIAILVAGAALAHGLARLLRAPAVPFLLGAGTLLVNVGLLDPQQLREPLTLGVTFLLFVGGMELNPDRVGAQKRAALRVGIAQFVLLGVAGFGAAAVFGFDLQTSLYLALALTASSTLVVVQLMQRRRHIFEPFGRLVLGVLLLQDLMVIALIPLVSGARTGALPLVRQFGATLALMAIAFLCMRWLAGWLIRLRHDEESLLLVTLALLFVFVGIADALNVPLVAGAFLAGVALSRFPVSGLVGGQLRPITDFFAAVFFTALGGLVLIPGPAQLFQAVAFAALVIVLTSPIVVFVAERAGFSARPALESGLLLSQTSELSLVVVLQGMVFGQIDAQVFTVVAITTALTMLLTPVIATEPVTRWLLRFHPMRREAHVRREPRDHVVLIGCGAAGMPLLETLLAGGHDVVVVDDDPAVVDRLREGGVPSIRGDALDPGVLRDAGIAAARIITSTVRRPQDNRLLLETVRDVPVLVRVFEDDEATWVRSMGGRPVVSAEAAATAFFRWYDEYQRGDEENDNFNTEFAEKHGTENDM